MISAVMSAPSHLYVISTNSKAAMHIYGYTFLSADKRDHIKLAIVEGVRGVNVHCDRSL